MGKRKTSHSRSLFDADEPAAGPSHPERPTQPTRARGATAEAPPEFPLPADLDTGWLSALTPETHKPYWNDLQRFVAAEQAHHTVYPPAEDVYNAFRYTPLAKVKVVLLGQDPYPGVGQAHGLCFSVRPGVRLPGSLRNIYQELQSDLGVPPVKHGYLAAWAKQGVLLLNACLTVRADAPNSHAGKGWEHFTDAALKAVDGQKRTIVFLLWGAYAKKKVPLVDQTRHVVVTSAHPSPLSAASGFFGSRPFSKVNAALEAAGEKPIDWRLPESV
jgi:uracil-DNA glycosylase